MWTTTGIWLASAVLVFAVLAVAGARRPRSNVPFNWKTAIVLAAIAGGAPAFLYQQWGRAPVDVPAGINTGLPPR